MKERKREGGIGTRLHMHDGIGVLAKKDRIVLTWSTMFNLQSAHIHHDQHRLREDIW